MANFFPCASTDDIKAIHGNDIANGDIILLGTSTYASIYYLNASSGATENIPLIIAPTNAAGAKRWIRIYNTAATVTVGTTTTGLPKSLAQVTNSGTIWNAILDFVIPQGPKGIDWKSEYSGTTSYLTQDAVFYNDKCYLCIAPSTGNLPTDTNYWKELTFGPIIDSEIYFPFIKSDGSTATVMLDGNALVAHFDVTGTLPIVVSNESVPKISINEATVSTAGSMSSSDKTKLDAVSDTVVNGEIRLTPKASSSSTADGTIFYCSDDKSVYVGVA
jgi:hypothetical protein